jgi:hypothetical protein
MADGLHTQASDGNAVKSPEPLAVPGHGFGPILRVRPPLSVHRFASALSTLAVDRIQRKNIKRHK